MTARPASGRAPLVRRSAPAKRRDYRDYREPLREDFWFACAYCSVTEVEAGGVRFTIDHYEAQSKVPERIADYDNLMWCCDHCNQRKGDRWPDERFAARGVRVFRPDQDHPDDHFGLQEANLEPLTEIGRYTTALLDLNRATLRRLRELRRRLSASQAEVLGGLRALADVRLDDLPPASRARFLHVRAELLAEASRGEADLRAIIEHLSRSHMLDPDESAHERSRERRAWLRAQGALVADGDDEGL